MRPVRPLSILFPLLGLTLLAPRAAAQAPIDEGTRATARQLADDAAEDLQRGDAASALDKYRRADALVHLPTISVRIARCLEKLGRYLEASELYLAVTHMDTGPDPRGLQAEAKQQAEAERAVLLPRIPAVVVTVEHPPAALEVTLDGKPLPPALFGVKRLLDPGPHRILGRAGGVTVTRDVEAKPGEVSGVSIDLASLPATPAAPSPPVGPAERGAPATPPRRMAAIVLGSLGGAGIVAGAVTGGLMFAKKGAIGDGCVDKGAHFECNAAGKSAADAAKTFGLASTVAFAAGAGLVAAAVVLRVTEPGAQALRSGRKPPSRWVGASVQATGAAGALLTIGGAL